mmetsp:Transcript_37585/g.91201  ORF Transcript_37585/g.91201 Transcript_37585/m.91201 type:complete len:291 (+) Transcript_37585:301-1173(+)
MSFFASFLPTKSFENSASGSDNEGTEVLSQSSDEETCSRLKDHLRSLLNHHHGSTKEQDVIDVIENLSALSPYKKHSHEWLELFMGEFFAETSPNFPSRLPPAHEGDKRVQYTLGKLSFNTFHPNNLVCTLLGVRNAVAPNPDGTFTYDLICDIVVHLAEGEDIEAEICNESYCCKDDESDRIHVFFSGSKLSPAPSVLENDCKMSLWCNTFNEATLKTAEAKRTYFGWFMDQALKRMLGMNVRVDESNSFRLEFKKAIKGHFDVLYLDEEMRITKGNRGTLVVVERLCQ